MTGKRFKSRCYEKQKNVVIYDKSDKLFDVSYKDFEDAYYLKMKLIPVIDKLNELNEENQRLTDKLNQTALELVDGVISQGKAVEISEMSYREFLDYRAKNGKPMELQL